MPLALGSVPFMHAVLSLPSQYYTTVADSHLAKHVVRCRVRIRANIR